MATTKQLAERLEQTFTSKIEQCRVANCEVTIVVKEADLTEVLTDLKTKDEFGFEILIDLCGVDYSTYGKTEWKTEVASNTGFSRAVKQAGEVSTDVVNDKPRFAVVYHLLSIKNNHRLRIRTMISNNDFPQVDSVIDIWSAADWFEREAFDLFGIIFDGHPDLRRLLTDYGFIGHPFRKDFPLIGQVEMRYDPEKKRVVYEPVSIEPRVLVPRVIRNDHRYENPSDEKDSKPDA